METTIEDNTCVLNDARHCEERSASSPDYSPHPKEMKHMKDNILGRRFACNGYVGTVHYVGLLPGTDDTWLGVEWDDKTRGKHNGSYKGQEYFITKFPTAGSFIRPNKVDFGISYSKAVGSHYGYEAPADKDNNKDLRIIRSSTFTKPIELLGMDKIGNKQSQFDQLTNICLSNMNVNGIDENENLTTFTPNVIELDLSKNLLSSWKDVADIVQYVKKLTVLDVSGNRLRTSEIDSFIQNAFKNIREVKMAAMAYTWLEIKICGSMFPVLENLTLSLNEISVIHKINEDIFQHLKFLELDSNPIASWEEILKFGHLPMLEVLHLNDCGIKNIIFPDCSSEEKSKFFPKLTTLRLSDNCCNKWTDIDELNKLQNLFELRINNNPICEDFSYETTRQIIIAKIQHLKILNRIEISDAERRGAELDYLKKYGQLWLKVNKDNIKGVRGTFLKEHPRYMQLIQKYGAAEESELKVPQTDLKSKMITLEIDSPQSEQKFKKRLPSTMTVEKFKRLLQQLYKINHQDLQISYISSKDTNEQTKFVLDNDLKDLSFYAIENGDKIIVSW